METETINKSVFKELKYKMSINRKQISNESEHDSDTDFECDTVASTQSNTNQQIKTIEKTIDYSFRKAYINSPPSPLSPIEYSYNRAYIKIPSPPSLSPVNSISDSSVVNTCVFSNNTPSHVTTINYNPILKMEQMREGVEKFVQNINTKLITIEQLNTEIKTDLECLMQLLN
jgi:hypothetical protein